ncbi:MAG: hypothetical protein AAF203_04650, partial [Pseudomonadota bacterium]
DQPSVDEATIYCFYPYSYDDPAAPVTTYLDVIVHYPTEKRIHGCTENVSAKPEALKIIDNAPNVCYQGKPEDLVQRINDGEFVWDQGFIGDIFLRDASYKGSTVSYSGVHERGTALKPFIYHVAIEPCTEDFFKPADKIIDTIVFDM